jgi:hypothetical protein
LIKSTVKLIDGREKREDANLVVEDWRRVWRLGVATELEFWPEDDHGRGIWERNVRFVCARGGIVGTLLAYVFF